AAAQLRCDYSGGCAVYRRHGGGRPGLERDAEGHGGAEVLLPARSDAIAVFVSERTGVYRAPGLGSAGGIDQQHFPDQAEPEHDGEHRDFAGKDLAGQRAAVWAERDSVLPNRYSPLYESVDLRHQQLLELLSGSV